MSSTLIGIEIPSGTLVFRDSDTPVSSVAFIAETSPGVWEFVTDPGVNQTAQFTETAPGSGVWDLIENPGGADVLTLWELDGDVTFYEAP